METKDCTVQEVLNYTTLNPVGRFIAPIINICSPKGIRIDWLYFMVAKEFSEYRGEDGEKRLVDDLFRDDKLGLFDYLSFREDNVGHSLMAFADRFPEHFFEVPGEYILS